MEYNGIETNVIKSFLKEFNKQYVTGRMIEMYKQDNTNKLLDGLKLQFTPKNQAYGIWMIIKANIENLGANDLNDKLE